MQTTVALPIPNLTGYPDADRDLAAEARLGGHLITKGLTSESHYVGGAARVLRMAIDRVDQDGNVVDVDDETIASEVKRIWNQMIEPSMGLQRIAAMHARGWDDPRVWLSEAALDWPIYRAAAAGAVAS